MYPWEYCKLHCDDTYIYYSMYQQDGMHTVLQPYNDHLWASSLNTLGAIGWEAISVIGIANERHWYFKRISSTDNYQFAFPG